MLQSIESMVERKRETTLRSALERQAATDVWLRIADAGAIVLAMVVGYYLRFGSQIPSPVQRTAMATVFLYALICFGLSPLYRDWRGRSMLRELFLLVITWLVVYALFSMHALLVQMGDGVSRQWLAYTFLLGGTGMIAVHSFVRARISAREQHESGSQRVVAVGLRSPVLKLHRHLQGNPGAGLNIVGYFASEYDRQPSREAGVPLRLGTMAELDTYLRDNHADVDQVWVSLPLTDRDNVKGLLKMLERYPLLVKLVPDIQDFGLLNPSVELIGQVPVINLRQGLTRSDFLLVKRVQDIVVAAIAVALLLPLYLALAIGVKLSSPGPVFFRQKRHGLGGKEFQMLKFRSMRIHQEETDKVTQATRNDPRVTRFGAFIRRTSLDELPQFLNVLGGSMSVVGPRPHAVQHNNHYERIIDRYMQRHYVKPGITGWAQVHGLRGEILELRAMRRRVRYDIDYIRRWSLGLDLKIIVLTALKVLNQKTAY